MWNNPDAQDSSRLKPVPASPSSRAQAVCGIGDLNGCFVAGTLVHTREGLVPIEAIKVGDWVLSQPENKGERAYKRVVNTFRFEEKSVWAVDVIRKDALEENAQTCVLVEPEHTIIVGTGNHPFWVKSAGWTRMDQLDDSCEFELSDGSPGIIMHVAPVQQTTLAGIGWVQNMFEYGVGNFIDFRETKTPHFKEGESEPNPDIDWWEKINQYKSVVFNLEVEGNHTYYVGAAGIWVHNANCGGDVGANAPLNGDRPRFFVPRCFFEPHLLRSRQVAVADPTPIASR